MIEPIKKCFATTNSVTINSDGSIVPCCKYHDDFAHLDDFSTLSNINQSKKFIELKRLHHFGISLPGCHGCDRDEKRNIESRRQNYTKRYTDDDYYIDISLSNYCNLKCRTCIPELSTRWFDDYAFLKKQGLVIDNKHYTAKTISDSDLEKIFELIKNLDKKRIIIEVKGGEPFLGSGAERFFKKLSQLRNSDKIIIELFSNGTYYPEWLASIVPNFMKFNLWLSIDGMHDVYEYIRGDNTRHTYSNFLINLDKFRKLETIDLKLIYLVQNTNVHQVQKFQETFIDNICWQILEYPAHYKLKNMPEKSKSLIIDDLKLITPTGKNEFYKISHMIDMLLEPLDPKSYENYIKFSAHLDNRRNQRLINIVPHMLDEPAQLLYRSIIV